jgi:hypothetical protein
MGAAGVTQQTAEFGLSRLRGITWESVRHRGAAVSAVSADAQAANASHLGSYGHAGQNAREPHGSPKKQ